MLNWLTKRLSPVKKDSSRWVDLSKSLEETWETHFNPGCDALAGLKSIYTSSEEGQRKKLAEYGERYEKNLAAKHLPVALAMRKLEMLQKDTAFPSEMMIIRSLGSTAENPVKPLYALSSEPYGTYFYTDEQLAEIGVTADYSNIEYQAVRQVDGTWKLTVPASVQLGRALPFLTSRVGVCVDLSELVVPPDVLQIKEDFAYLKPLHIVLDRLIFVINMQIDIRVQHSYYLFMEKSLTQYVSRNKRIDGSWKLGSQILHEARSIDGSWKLQIGMNLGQYYTNGTVYATLRDLRIATAGILTKQIERPDNYLAARLSESHLRLDKTWKVGNNRILTLVGGTEVNKRSDAPVNTRSEIVHSFKGEIVYPKNPVKIIPLITLSPGWRINGSWKLGQPALAPKKLNGSWRILTPGVKAESSKHLSLHGYIHAMSTVLDKGTRLDGLSRLDGLWKVGAGLAGISLNGTWTVGGGRRVRLFSGKTISKSTELSSPIIALASSKWDKSFFIQYASNNTRLGKLVSLNGSRLNGGWRVGEPASSNTRQLNGTWKIRFNDGVKSHTSGAHILGGKSLSVSVRRLSSGAARIAATPRLLDGKWRVGAYNNLNGRWKLGQPGIRLSSPKLTGFGLYRLDGNWTLGTHAYSRLDGSWKVGEAYGPSAESWINITRSHH